MINIFFIVRIAFYEAKLLFRSWGFRIFSGLVLVFICFFNIAIVSRSIPTPYYISSLSGSLPLNSLKFLNIFQGIFVAFMATEFFKRDRKHDSMQVILARSFPNLGYFLGKALGIFSVFLFLNLAVLAITFVIHFFFSSTVFAWQPYILYTLLISLPTLIFMIGFSFFLSSLLRSQAVVFIILLAYSFLALVVIGTPFFGLFDSYAFYLPLMWSDFVGLGNIQSVLLLRFAYFFLGLSFFLVSSLLFKRLRQSAFANTMTGSFSIVFLVLAMILGVSYIRGLYANRDFRQKIKASSQELRGVQTAAVRSYDIRFEHAGEKISAAARMEMVNGSQSSLDSILLTINPGLKVETVTQGGLPLDFQQDNHLLHINPAKPIASQDFIFMTVTYSGKIDERYCFLDIENKRYESRYRVWVYDIPKRYAFVTSDFVHLTPESGWYPIPGLPAGAAYPAAAAASYSKYTLTVTASKGQTVISQGKPEIRAQGGIVQHIFKPEVQLPKMSLTIGSYEHHEIVIDNLTYSLYTRPGHDYFVPLMNKIHDQNFDGQGSILEYQIRESLAELEMSLGVYYPYKRLSLVEVPVNVSSYHRLWTVAHETVQPQLIFIPEMATVCTYGQLQFPLETEQSLRGREVPVGWDGIQRGVLWRFVNWNLMGNTNYMDPVTADTVNRMRRNRIGFNFHADIETQFDLFPNFFYGNTQVFSPQWPVLNFVLESYMRDRVAVPLTMYRETSIGLSPVEQANFDLRGRSLADLIEDQNLETAVVHGALQAKAQSLMALIEALYGEDDFQKKLTRFLKDQRHSIISAQELEDFLAGLGGIDLADLVEPWYSGSEVPGFLVRDIQSYEIIEGERARIQVKLLIANPTSVDGITKISLRGRPVRRGPRPALYTRALYIPAQTTFQVGFVMDEAPQQLNVDTFVSQNIPSSLDLSFWEKRTVKDKNPFRGEIAKPYDRGDFFPEGEIIVDNEDEGFSVLGTAKQHWLSRILQNMLGIKEDDPAFTAMNFLDPPQIWTQSTNPYFYGEFVRSAYLKKSGEGREKVVWKADIPESGDYDIYYYQSIPKPVRQGAVARPSSGRQQSSQAPRAQGQKFFSISSREGREEVEIDLDNADLGWNLVGTFPLETGFNFIELSDKNDAGFVLADAVKWVKR